MSFAAWSKRTGALKSFVSTFPLIAGFFSKFTGLAFPPVGDYTTMARFVSVIVIGASGLLMYGKRSTRSLRWKLFVSFALAALVYLCFSLFFVQAFPLSSGAKAFVTFGKLRPELVHPGIDPVTTAYSLVHDNGRSDWQLLLVFTRWSLLLSRASLLISYIVCLALLHAFIALRANELKKPAQTVT